MLEVRKLDQNYSERVKAFLLAHAESSLFMLSNMCCVGLDFRDAPYHGEYLGALDSSGDICGLIVHYWNGSIMMQAPGRQVLALLVDEFRRAASRPVTGILGEEGQARFVIEKLGMSGASFSTNGCEGLYALNLSSFSFPSIPANFDVAPLSNGDRALLREWLKAYEMEALGREDSESFTKHIDSRVERMIQEGNAWLLRVNGKAVSLSAFNARIPEMVQLGPVWTPPEHRNQGYARLLVASTLAVVRNQGVAKAILFTDNPSAIRAYEVVGFRKIGQYRLALLDTEIRIEKSQEI